MQSKYIIKYYVSKSSFFPAFSAHTASIILIFFILLISATILQYDRFLDEAPDIPSISIRAFNEAFPNKENKPDVCNGLSIINCDMGSEISNPISRWLSSVKNMRISRKSLDNSVEV